MASNDYERESIEVLQRLVRFNTVNPPGNERPAIEYLEEYLREAGFATEVLGASDDRPNLIATLTSESDGPVLCFLGHVDTVLADAGEWSHDPWSGDLADGFLWGRGALDMKSQVAAEAVAGATLARAGLASAARRAEARVRRRRGDRGRARRPVADHAPSGQGPLRHAAQRGRRRGVRVPRRSRRYGVCCAEKGVFRFTITATGVAGHASLPRTGDNALLEAGPGAARSSPRRQPSFDLTPGPGRPAAEPRRGPRRSGRRRAAARGVRSRPARVPGADARGDTDADDGQGVGQDQRDPLAGPAERRLPRAAGARRGYGAASGSTRSSASTAATCGSSSWRPSAATSPRSSRR